MKWVGAMALAASAGAFIWGQMAEPQLGNQAWAGTTSASGQSLLHPRYAFASARARLVGVAAAAGEYAVDVSDLDEMGEEILVQTEPPDTRTVPAIVAAAAPPVDVAAEIRSELTAIVRGSSGATLLLVDGFGRRSVKAGEIYKDGWRLVSVSGGEIVLAKGKNSMALPVIQAPAPEPRPSPQFQSAAFVPAEQMEPQPLATGEAVEEGVGETFGSSAQSGARRQIMRPGQ